MNLLLACLAGGAVSLVVGFIWYNPNVFGKMWMAEVGMTEEDAQNGNMGLIFGISFLVSAYLSYEMKWVNHPDELNPFVHGMYHGARHVGIFAAGAIIINALFEQKSVRYIAINAGYWLVVFAMIGGTLASFPSFKPAEENTEENTEESSEDTSMILEENFQNTTQTLKFYEELS